MGNCFVCGHRDGLNKYSLAKRWHPMSHWSTIDKYLRCTKCGNKLCNSFSFEIVEETQ